MKKILLIAVIMAVYGGATAQLKFTENFGGMTGTTLGTQNTWDPTPVSGTDVGLVVLANNTGALVYPGYTSGQNYVTVARTDGRDPYRIFTSGGGGVSTVANSTFFVSFLVRVPSASTIQSTTSADYSITLRNSGNVNYLCRFYIGKDASNNIEFGISANANKVFTNGNYAANTTYLIVMRYDVITGNNNDNSYLWVNPSLSSEPTIVSANASDLSDDIAYGSTINAIMIHQRSASNSPIAHFDAFRVSNNTTSVIAWADLTPQGIPLPVKLGAIKAYEKQAGVQIDWSAYSEENLSKYQVERSADGVTFTALGDVTANNSLAVSNYGFFDTNPMAGVNFYRLKSIDADGKFAYSSIVRVNLDKNVKGITVYPNPVTNGYVSFQSADLAKGNYTVKLFTATGQQVYSQRFAHSGGAINQTIQLPNGTKSGMYSIQLDNDAVKVMTKTFIVQ